MSSGREVWNARNEMLNALESAIVRDTRGRLSKLSVEVVDEAVVVEASAPTYYAIQLTLAAIHRCASECPRAGPLRLAFCVGGHSFVVSDPFDVRRDQPTAKHIAPTLLSERFRRDSHDAKSRPLAKLPLCPVSNEAT